MANVRTLSRSFAAGEITPELFGRVDLSQFQTGLALCRNFRTLPHGPAENRAGFEYVLETKTSSKRSRVIPFTYSPTQTMVLEFGDGYVRFHTQGGTLLETAIAATVGATAITATTSYANGDWIFLSTAAGTVYGTVQNQTGTSFTLARPDGTTVNLTPFEGTATVSRVYTITTPYSEADLFDIRFVQSADVLTLVHQNYPPAELRRLGATNWQYAAIAFNPSLSAPTGVAVSALASTGRYGVQGVSAANPAVFTATGNDFFNGSQVTLQPNTGTNWSTLVGLTLTVTNALSNSTFWLLDASGNPINGTLYAAWPGGAIQHATVAYGYVVTAIAQTTLEESIASSAVSCNNDLTQPAAKNRITWSAVAGAVRYNVYKLANGLYGYIGQTDQLTFDDANITADITQTPPQTTTALQSATNYPGAVSYAQQRRCFASTISQPQNMWMTRTGTESNLTASIPSQADDAITFRVAARESNRIQHIVPMASLILLTDSAEWMVSAGANIAITPSTIAVQPQTYVGASGVTPQVVDYSLLYAANRGGHVREMTYQWQNSGYISQDISLMAPHLFDYLTLTDSAYQRSPYPIFWVTSSSGDLLGLTYSPRQQVSAWHHHDTDGAFESICSVTEGTEDVLYAIVNRTINGRQVRYVERMHTRQMATLADAFFVDAGSTYSGTPTTTVTGLYHLEGKTVSILADGAVMPQQVVANGTVTIQQPASKITVGLPIIADLQTLPFSCEMPAFGQGRQKNINRVWLRVSYTSGILVGPTLDTLVQYKQRTIEPYASPPNPVTGVIEITPRAAWDEDAQVFVRQTDPLPATVASVVIEASIGG